MRLEARSFWGRCVLEHQESAAGSKTASAEAARASQSQTSNEGPAQQDGFPQAVWVRSDRLTARDVKVHVVLHSSYLTVVHVVHYPGLELLLHYTRADRKTGKQTIQV